MKTPPSADNPKFAAIRDTILDAKNTQKAALHAIGYFYPELSRAPQAKIDEFVRHIKAEIGLNEC